MSNNVKVLVEKRISEKFNDPNAEMRFISSDGVGFNIYKEHLKSTSEVLQVPEHTLVDSESTRVPLTERSQVLELMFQFIRVPPGEKHGRHPDLAAITDTRLFFDLAEAGEKYGVYSLNTACIITMELMLFAKRQNCVEILDHCLRHDHQTRLIDEASRQALSKPLADVIKGLTRVQDVQNWLAFHGAYMQCRNNIADRIKSDADSFTECLYLRNVFMEYWKATTRDLGTVGDIPFKNIAIHRCTQFTRGGCWAHSLDNYAERLSASVKPYSQMIKNS